MLGVKPSSLLQRTCSHVLFLTVEGKGSWQLLPAEERPRGVAVERTGLKKICGAVLFLSP